MSVVSTGNCKPGHDCRRVCVHTADATRLDSFVSSASAVCIGHLGAWFFWNTVYNTFSRIEWKWEWMCAWECNGNGNKMTKYNFSGMAMEMNEVMKMVGNGNSEIHFRTSLACSVMRRLHQRSLVHRQGDDPPSFDYIHLVGGHRPQRAGP